MGGVLHLEDAAVSALHSCAEAEKEEQVTQGLFLPNRKSRETPSLEPEEALSSDSDRGSHTHSSAAAPQGRARNPSYADFRKKCQRMGGAAAPDKIVWSDPSSL